MTRKESIENKLLELIEHVKDAPKKEALLAVGLDMAEWADKTLIDNACKYLKEHKEFVETEDNGIMGWIPDYFIEDFKKAMED